MKLCDLTSRVMTLCGLSSTATNQTAKDYKARMPDLADLGQRELLNNVEKSFIYTKTAKEGTDEYVSVDMPTDFGGLSCIIDTETTGAYIKSPAYYIEVNKLYIRNDYKGTLRIRYKPVPTPLTSFDDDLLIDGNTAEALIYYIAGNLLLEENGDKASYYIQKFEELKERLKTRPAAFEPIHDVYDTSCRG